MAKRNINHFLNLTLIDGKLGFFSSYFNRDNLKLIIYYKGIKTQKLKMRK